MLSYSKTGNKKRATCFATLLQNKLNSDVTCFNRPTFEPVLQLRFPVFPRFFFSWVMKRTTLPFNSFCSQVTKQVALFLLPFFPYLKAGMHLRKLIHTSKFQERFLLDFRSQPKINELSFVMEHINQDVFWFKISMEDAIFLAANISLQDLREVPSRFVLCQCRPEMKDVKQVFANFWSFHRINVVFVRCKKFVHPDHVTVACLVLKIGLSWNWSAINLHREQEMVSFSFFKLLD